jgi:hypothetical protein
VHPGHKLMGPKEEEEEESWNQIMCQDQTCNTYL